MIGPRVRAGAVLLSTFALGVLTGVAIERHREVSRPSESADSGTLHARTMADLREAVGLDDAQVAEIEALMEKHREVVHLAWQSLRPEVQRAMQSLHVEIAQTIRPDQRERFHEWLLRRREADAASHSSPTSEEPFHE